MATLQRWSLCRLSSSAKVAQPCSGIGNCSRSARKLIDEHGLEATDAALQRADDMAQRGDLNGEAVWLAVGRKIELLLAHPSGLPN